MSIKNHNNVLFLLAAFALTALNSSAFAALSDFDDEFDNETTLSSWKRHYLEERWGDQVEVISITDGNLYLMPYACGWYNDRRGPHIYKEIDGDFVIHALVTSRGRSQRVPNRHYSLGGVFIRESPAYGTQANWISGQENYIFMSIGSAGNPGTPQYEIKSTTDSNSVLNYYATPDGELTMEIKVGRLRSELIAIASRFVRVNDTSGEITSYADWTVHRRYDRNDWAAVSTLNVGFTSYTDWNTVDNYATEVYNNISHLVEGPPHYANPDLKVYVDYARFTAPDTVRMDAIASTADGLRTDASDYELLRILNILNPPMAVDWCLSCETLDVTIYQGTKITFTNTDGFDHTVTSVSGQSVSVIASGDIAGAGTFAYTFDAIGEVNIVCDYHSGMTGTIVVLALPSNNENSNSNSTTDAPTATTTTATPTASPTAQITLPTSDATAMHVLSITQVALMSAIVSLGFFF